MKLRKVRHQKNDVEDFGFISEEDLEKEINQLYLDNVSSTHFCFKCNVVKNERAHHCKTCKRCVIRMDHHCPWTGNCVGIKNTQFFIQFLFHASVTILIIFPYELFALCRLDLKYDRTTFIVMIIHNFIGISTGIAIFYLFYYQVRNARINITTIEENINGIKKVKPFDKG